MNKMCLLTCLFFMPLLPVLAQDTAELSLTLQQAIGRARENSPIAKKVKADYNAATWRYKSQKAGRLPQLSLNGDLPGINRTINSITQPDGTVLFVPQSQAISSTSMQLSQSILPTGGTISFYSGITRIDLFENVNTSYWQTVPILFNYHQPLTAYNSARWGWRQAVLSYELNRKRYIEQTEELSILVTQRFFNLFIAGMELENAQSNLRINDTLYRVSQGRFSLGKIAENELLQIELQLMNAQNSLEQLTWRYTSAQKELAILLGTKGTRIMPLALEEIPAFDIPPEKALLEAMDNRSDITGFQIARNNAEMQLRDARAASFFNGALNLSYGLNQTSSNLNTVYQDPLSSQRFSVNFSMPIMGWGKNRANYIAAKYEKESQEADIENAVNSFEIQIVNQVLEFNQLRKSLVISSKSDTVARKRYELAKNRYLIGKIDITNLNIAQNEKDQARISYFRNLQNFWVAYYQLRRITLYDFGRNEKIRW